MAAKKNAKKKTAKKSGRKKAGVRKKVETLTHEEAKRSNIPTAELQSVMNKADQSPISVAYERRNRDLDPQLVWRGKDMQDWSDLVVQAPPLFIQEKVHPKALIDDLLRSTEKTDSDAAASESGFQTDLFADFNGVTEDAGKTEFYQHEQNWSNRMILGDSLQVMASLAEREGLRGKVQCIYFDPPYGIKFNSNFQWSTTSRDVKDGKADHITREPEQVKAFRDTWRDGIHSYLTYLRDRLTVARDLLTESGSIFVQIGDENVHRVRAVMDEVFGDDNFVAAIVVQKTASATSDLLSGLADYLLCYAKNKETVKYRRLFYDKIERGSDERYDQVEDSRGIRRGMTADEKRNATDLSEELRRYQLSALTSTKPPGDFPVSFQGKEIKPRTGFWKTGPSGFEKLKMAQRIVATAGGILRYVRYLSDFPVVEISAIWNDISGSVQSRSDPKVYVVQTGTAVVQRCIQMATDPGDLVLDPTCGSGTTAFAAEQWGRRWITIDTSRVALALARARLMGARYPFYLLADSREGQLKEASVSLNARVRSRSMGTFATGLSINVFPTSCSSPLPTTWRSMSSGPSGRQSWSRCARS